jgi:hypothetical protein
VREETVKEKASDGKVFGLYQVPHRSFIDPTGRGKSPLLNEKDTIVRRAIEELPDVTWKPVEATDAKLEQQYRAKA